MTLSIQDRLRHVDICKNDAVLYVVLRHNVVFTSQRFLMSQRCFILKRGFTSQCHFTSQCRFTSKWYVTVETSDRWKRRFNIEKSFLRRNFLTLQNRTNENVVSTSKRQFNVIMSRKRRFNVAASQRLTDGIVERKKFFFRRLKKSKFGSSVKKLFTPVIYECSY